MMTAALIIAAGTTPRRDGFAPTQKIGILSAVQRIILTFRQAGVEEIVVVSAQEGPKLEKHAGRLGVTFLQQPAAKGEMLDSIKTGLAYLAGRCENILLSPVSIPLFTMETVQQLMAANGDAVVPSYKGKAGHPLRLAAGLFSCVLSYDEGGGLQGALQAAGVDRHFVTVHDEGVVLNIERRQVTEDLLEKHSLRRLHPRLKLQLAREQTFFGPGAQQLLQLIRNTGSVRLACALMGISYSKGWKMLAVMEQEMGCLLVERQPGGVKGGRANLTKEGEQILSRYRAFAEESEAQVRQIFARHFPQQK